MVVQWLVLFLHRKKAMDLNLMAIWGLSVCTLHVSTLPPSVFFPQPSDMQIKSVNVNLSVNSCFSLCQPCCHLGLVPASA